MIHSVEQLEKGIVKYNLRIDRLRRYLTKVNITPQQVESINKDIYTLEGYIYNMKSVIKDAQKPIQQI